MALELPPGDIYQHGALEMQSRVIVAIRAHMKVLQTAHKAAGQDPADIAKTFGMILETVGDVALPEVPSYFAVRPIVVNVQESDDAP